MTAPRPAGSAAVRLLAVLLVWQVAARALSSSVFPAPTDLLRELHRHGVGTVLRPARVTLVEAGAGFVLGNAAAIALGTACVRWRRFEAAGLQVALLTYTVPVIALGAIMSTLWSATAVRITIAALYVVFTTTMGTVLGLRSADDRALDLLTVYGASPRRQLVLVRFPAAAPTLLAALRIAAPAAVLGAIVGEYLGGSGGLGVAMVASQRSGAVARTWALALTGALLAGIGWWLLGLVGRWWAARSPVVGIPRRAVAPPAPSGWTRPAAVVAQVAASVVAVLLAWYGLLRLLDVDTFVGRTPREVGRYLVTGPAAAAHRGELWSALQITLGHAGVGFVVGTAAGVSAAVAFHLLPRVERLVLPFAVAAQAMPVVAFLPVALLLLGRGAALAAVVAGLVSFFPALVNVDAGLRRTPSVATDLLVANGATPARVLVLARLPYAAPAVLAAARIAIPASVAGALLVEWMVLGDGMGDLMLGSATRYRYDTMWAAVVVVSVSTILLASAAHAAERLALRRLG